MLNPKELLCPNCRLALPDALYNRGAFSFCPSCGAAVRCEVFPAQFTELRIGRAGELLVDASEASCFFHPEKRAAVACDSCGRFLCALCDLDFAGRHMCPTCLAAGRKKGTLGNLDHYRFSWSGFALLKTILPLIILPFLGPSIRAFRWIAITATTAIVSGIVGLRKPQSLTGRRGWVTLTLAFVFALTEIGVAIAINLNSIKSFFGGE